MAELASWNDTATRQAIEEYVASASASAPADRRVAVFDNDGTLWCEKPMPIQLDFILRRWGAMAADDASLRERQPFKAAHTRDFGWLSAAITKHYEGDDSDVKLLMAGVNEAFDGMSVDAYADAAAAFFADAEHPTLKRPYTTCAYQPMVELLRYLEANGFSTFIASGGDRDFMRAIAEPVYGIPAERVIGSSFADGLRLLVNHDDPEREIAYSAGAETALAAGFNNISVKDDWATVFADTP